MSSVTDEGLHVHGGGVLGACEAACSSHGNVFFLACTLDVSEAATPTERKSNREDEGLEDFYKIDSQVACQLAVQCCLTLHQTLHGYATGCDDKVLTLHIGVGFGQVHILQVRSRQARPLRLNICVGKRRVRSSQCNHHRIHLEQGYPQVRSVPCAATLSLVLTFPDSCGPDRFLSGRSTGPDEQVASCRPSLSAVGVLAVASVLYGCMPMSVRCTRTYVPCVSTLWLADAGLVAVCVRLYMKRMRILFSWTSFVPKKRLL